MSHDQRPGRMRVVKDSSVRQGRRHDDGQPGQPNAAGAGDANGGAALSGAGVAQAKGGSISLVAVLFFLIACGIGAAAFVIFNPFGIG